MIDKILTISLCISSIIFVIMIMSEDFVYPVKIILSGMLIFAVLVNLSLTNLLNKIFFKKMKDKKILKQYRRGISKQTKIKGGKTR